MNCNLSLLRVAFPALLLLCAPLAAQDEGHWIDLFDGETTYGWNSFGDAQWGANEGILKCDKGSGGWIATTSQFMDFELVAQVKLKPTTSSGIVFRAALEGHPTENGSSILWLDQPRDGDSKWREVRVVAQGDKVKVTVDGEESAFVQGARKLGYIGFLYHHNGRASVEFKDIKLRPLSMVSIFNGKNLDEWNVIPGHASKFEVTKKAISIKDGNGQIETKEVYKDFVVQLDIISNGEHLNSGVFYRGPVGQFWKGYESQVRNQWRGEDRSKPVDFGTGGNYGNLPARKVVSSDHEWFSKTIVSDGNHSAVWINGYLVSDYHDTRPVNRSNNAKEGYVPGPGTIHLQGHDPTTDLLFKNIAIQAYNP